MGKRGPPRTPKKILDLHGSRLAKERINEPEPAPEDQGAPTRPKALDKHPGARSVWNHIAPILERQGTLSKADREPLAHYCVMCAQWWAAAKTVEEEGAVIIERRETETTSSETCKSHPEVSRMIRLSGELRKLERLLGITAAARAGLAQTVPVKEQRRSAEDRLREKFGG